MTMTHKQAILAAVKREPVDILPFVPRIDMWYNARSHADTLPAEHKGKTRDQISFAEGWPLYNVLADIFHTPGNSMIRWSFRSPKKVMPLQ